MPLPASRRALLFGRTGGRERAVVRPPWAVSEDRFTDLCDRCGDCFSACDEGILIKGAAGFPEVNFQKGECTFCGDCVTACKPRALQRDEARAPWDLTLQITDKCLSTRGVTCRVCGDQCDTRALRFRLVVGGHALPEIEQTACTGCGACIGPCPVKGAIALIPGQGATENNEQGAHQP
ncbi:ferredoxin-type protein NapF [Magnetospira sp. QH-2]|uniref:ferredoxin-type protein NapF n=1 Tax=Magnetospira sp. (strain QH-2) TaxID=1288970 RepID=UPI0003E81B18|nr:ferredoxin-type protein NapF [Magnetospira sp. QH-2]CCQ73120.1 ferredoxin-type protein NapF [Magnetospira sp. QH-2]